MHTEKIKRQALKTQFKSLKNVNYSILIETTSKMATYNILIKSFLQNLQKTQSDSQIQIITFNKEVVNIFEFGEQPIFFKERLKEIKFSKLSSEANLGLALQECYENIEKYRPNDSFSHIIIFSSGLSSDNSSDSLIELMSLDDSKIYGFAGCGEEGSYDLQLLLPNIKVMPISRNLSQDIKLLISNGSINGGSSLNCPVLIEVYPHKNETQSIKDDLYLDVILKPDGNTSIIPAGSKVKFISNIYYSGYTIQVKNDILFGNPYEETIKLEYKKGQIENIPFENFPSQIEFIIELLNDIENTHRGFVSPNISYFLGDLKSNCRISIGVEGSIGTGKSTCLNGFVNLFNPFSQFIDYFHANSSPNNIVTRTVNSLSLKEILSSNQDFHPVQESFKDIDISWTDTWGFIESSYRLKHKAEGRVHHGTPIDDFRIQKQNDKYCIDCFIFVVSIKELATSVNRIEKKIQEVINIGLTPMLAITFVDSMTKDQYQELMKRGLEQLSVHKCNTFIINNYTEKDNSKDISKDIQYLRLLTKAVRICKTKHQRDQINKIKSQQSLFESPVKKNTKSFIKPSNSPLKTIYVSIDIVQEIDSELTLTTYDIEATLENSVSELKNIIINESGSGFNIADWNLKMENGSIIYDSNKLFSICEINNDSLKLILKKKEKI
ncbi:hypothetical protein RB653_002302 [Dictyostelium firmibasis]|uniref:VWFA domain-containing protein n=1 Tax=Dictyostelium firmibasis TaxID=79012 RepID=A0AAN7TX00_9MYCE